ncbi:alpha/beta fold hydrolase [Thalassobaculum sp.]|uniref:alpha/beta hydrolase n=1 Tax=Thalassobaculum sp. TaxID=2022740 RepID=UPI0032EF8096
MFRRHILPALAVLMLLTLPAAGQERVVLTAADGVPVTADVYAGPDAGAPWIVLAHMAGASRGEYREIAPRLNRLGYNAVALDQRSGSGFAGIPNETAAAGRARGMRQDYVSAIPDIEAGIAYARSRTGGPVLLWGSSYSAALALWLAGEYPTLVEGVVAVSPGEYLAGHSVVDAAPGIAVPLLIVSPPDEVAQWRPIYEAVPHDRKAHFSPDRGGRHGSSALVPSLSPGSEACWRAVETFLARYFGH